MGKIKTSISLEESTLAKIKTKADAEARSTSNWINSLLEREFLKKHRKTEKLGKGAK